MHAYFFIATQAHVREYTLCFSLPLCDAQRGTRGTTALCETDRGVTETGK